VRLSLLDYWGCSGGPIRRLAPGTRIILAALLFSACVVCQPSTVGGLACMAMTVAIWVVLCRPPRQLMASVLLFGAALLLPTFLLTPLLEVPGPVIHRLAIPWALFARGMAAMLITAVAIASMSLGELHDGFRQIGMPAIIAALVAQIIHQTGALVEESLHIGQALSLRCAEHGVRTAWRALFSLPRVWLPRVMLRAERVAAVMELRGYAGQVGSPHRHRFAVRDTASITAAAAWVALAIVSRKWWGAR
jgi:energy-coupling factor transporter transmembrane protein EcfT